MRWSGLRLIVCGILTIALLGCNAKPSKPPAVVEVPPVAPPEGWRMVTHVRKPGNYGETFLPKERGIPERMWVTIISQPSYTSKSIDELLQIFRPIFICKSKDMNVISKDANEMVFEEQDSVCYGKGYRNTIARFTKAHDKVSVYVYRADVDALPPDRREFVLKTIEAAPLDKEAPTGQAVAANAAPSAAASPQ
jgi:hypothetical protein